jgi:hypothetical protein
MSTSVDQQAPAAAESERAAPSQSRTLMLVVGSGRSGTSLFTGIMHRLGFHVPQPEVSADSTNPRGFAEPKWVVDFHDALLGRAGVQVADARPSAWAQTAKVAIDDDVRRRLREWLAAEFAKNDHVVIKDPRLSWFLPLWRQCAEDVGASSKYATVLRHPAAVIESKQRSYGNWQGDVERTAGWVNQVLFTERATRDGPRAFVKYQDLLDDWTGVTAHVGDVLDLAVVREAPAASIVKIHEFVDQSLSRSRSSWDDFEIPDNLRTLADEVWTLVAGLADQGADEQAALEPLEAARVSYIQLYEDAEAIAQSSITAAARAPATRSTTVRALSKVPRRYKRKIPKRWRATVSRALARSGLRS